MTGLDILRRIERIDRLDETDRPDSDQVFDPDARVVKFLCYVNDQTEIVFDQL